MKSKKRKLEIREIRKWLESPVSEAIRDEYEARREALQLGSMQGYYLEDPNQYAMDVGYITSLDQFAAIWEDPQAFLEALNEERVEEDEAHE